MEAWAIPQIQQKRNRGKKNERERTMDDSGKSAEKKGEKVAKKNTGYHDSNNSRSDKGTTGKRGTLGKG